MKYSRIMRAGLVLLSIVIIGCSEPHKPEQDETRIFADVRTQFLQVHKKPTCGCCGKWVNHIDERGFTTVTINSDDLSEFKLLNGIAPQYQSCHTAVSKDGYVFEGHIPAAVIHRFLQETPEDTIGLAVPGMPLGSPGMEVENRFIPYDVLLLKRDGGSEVYVHVANKKDQYK